MRKKITCFAILLGLLTFFIIFSQFLSPSQEEVGETENKVMD